MRPQPDLSGLEEKLSDGLEEDAEVHKLVQRVSEIVPAGTQRVVGQPGKHRLGQFLLAAEGRKLRAFISWARFLQGGKRQRIAAPEGEQVPPQGIDTQSAKEILAQLGNRAKRAFSKQGPQDVEDLPLFSRHLIHLSGASANVSVFYPGVQENDELAGFANRYLNRKDQRISPEIRRLLYGRMKGKISRRGRWSWVREMALWYFEDRFSRKAVWAPQEDRDELPKEVVDRAFADIEAAIRNLPGYQDILKTPQPSGQLPAELKAKRGWVGAAPPPRKPSVPNRQRLPAGKKSRVEIANEWMEASSALVGALIKTAPSGKDSPIGSGTRIEVKQGKGLVTRKIPVRELIKWVQDSVGNWNGFLVEGMNREKGKERIRLVEIRADPSGSKASDPASIARLPGVSQNLISLASDKEFLARLWEPLESAGLPAGQAGLEEGPLLIQPGSPDYDAIFGQVLSRWEKEGIPALWQHLMGREDGTVIRVRVHSVDEAAQWGAWGLQPLWDVVEFWKNKVPHKNEQKVDIETAANREFLVIHLTQPLKVVQGMTVSEIRLTAVKPQFIHNTNLTAGFEKALRRVREKQAKSWGVSGFSVAAVGNLLQQGRLFLVSVPWGLPSDRDRDTFAEIIRVLTETALPPGRLMSEEGLRWVVSENQATSAQNDRATVLSQVKPDVAQIKEDLTRLLKQRVESMVEPDPAMQAELEADLQRLSAERWVDASGVAGEGVEAVRRFLREQEAALRDRIAKLPERAGPLAEHVSQVSQALVDQAWDQFLSLQQEIERIRSSPDRNLPREAARKSRVLKRLAEMIRSVEAVLREGGPEALERREEMRFWQMEALGFLAVTHSLSEAEAREFLVYARPFEGSLWVSFLDPWGTSPTGEIPSELGAAWSSAIAVLPLLVEPDRFDMAGRELTEATERIVSIMLMRAVQRMAQVSPEEWSAFTLNRIRKKVREVRREWGYPPEQLRVDLLLHRDAAAWNLVGIFLRLAVEVARDQDWARTAEELVRRSENAYAKSEQLAGHPPWRPESAPHPGRSPWADEKKLVDFLGILEKTVNNLDQLARTDSLEERSFKEPVLFGWMRRHDPDLHPGTVALLDQLARLISEKFKTDPPQSKVARNYFRLVQVLLVRYLMSTAQMPAFTSRLFLEDPGALQGEVWEEQLKKLIEEEEEWRNMMMTGTYLLLVFMTPDGQFYSKTDVQKRHIARVESFYSGYAKIQRDRSSLMRLEEFSDHVEKWLQAMVGEVPVEQKIGVLMGQPSVFLNLSFVLGELLFQALDSPELRKQVGNVDQRRHNYYQQMGQNFPGYKSWFPPKFFSAELGEDGEAVDLFGDETIPGNELGARLASYLLGAGPWVKRDFDIHLKGPGEPGHSAVVSFLYPAPEGTRRVDWAVREATSFALQIQKALQEIGVGSTQRWQVEGADLDAVNVRLKVIPAEPAAGGSTPPAAGPSAGLRTGLEEPAMQRGQATMLEKRAERILSGQDPLSPFMWKEQANQLNLQQTWSSKKRAVDKRRLQRVASAIRTLEKRRKNYLSGKRRPKHLPLLARSIVRFVSSNGRDRILTRWPTLRGEHLRAVAESHWWDLGKKEFRAGQVKQLRLAYEKRLNAKQKSQFLHQLQLYLLAAVSPNGEVSMASTAPVSPLSHKTEVLPNWIRWNGPGLQASALTDELFGAALQDIREAIHQLPGYNSLRSEPDSRTPSPVKRDPEGQIRRWHEMSLGVLKILIQSAPNGEEEQIGNRTLIRVWDTLPNSKNRVVNHNSPTLADVRRRLERSDQSVLVFSYRKYKQGHGLGWVIRQVTTQEGQPGYLNQAQITTLIGRLEQASRRLDWSAFFPSIVSAQTPETEVSIPPMSRPELLRYWRGKSIALVEEMITHSSLHENHPLDGSQEIVVSDRPGVFSGRISPTRKRTLGQLRDRLKAKNLRIEGLAISRRGSLIRLHIVAEITGQTYPSTQKLAEYLRAIERFQEGIANLPGFKQRPVRQLTTGLEERETKSNEIKGQRVLLFTRGDDYGMALIRELENSSHQIVGVVTIPKAENLVRWAQARQISIWDASSYFNTMLVKEAMRNDPSFQSRMQTLAQELRKVQPDVSITAHFPHLPPSVVGVSAKALNVHPSELPKYAGGFTLPALILNGEPETMVTIHELTDTTDAGDIVKQKGGIPIQEQDDASTLQAKVVPVAAQLLHEALDDIGRGTYSATPQGPPEGPHAWGIKTRRVPDGTRILLRNEGLLTQIAIHWNQLNTKEILRRVRAFRRDQSNLSAYTNDEKGQLLFLVRAEGIEGSFAGQAGQVLRTDEDGGVVLKTADGAAKVWFEGTGVVSLKVGSLLNTTTPVSGVTGIPQSDPERIQSPAAGGSTPLTAGPSAGLRTGLEEGKGPDMSRRSFLKVGGGAGVLLPGQEKPDTLIPTVPSDVFKRIAKLVRLYGELTRQGGGLQKPEELIQDRAAVAKGIESLGEDHPLRRQLAEAEKAFREELSRFRTADAGAAPDLLLQAEGLRVALDRPEQYPLWAMTRTLPWLLREEFQVKGLDPDRELQRAVGAGMSPEQYLADLAARYVAPDNRFREMVRFLQERGVPNQLSNPQWISQNQLESAHAQLVKNGMQLTTDGLGFQHPTLFLQWTERSAIEHVFLEKSHSLHERLEARFGPDTNFVETRMLPHRENDVTLEQVLREEEERSIGASLAARRNRLSHRLDNFLRQRPRESISQEIIRQEKARIRGLSDDALERLDVDQYLAEVAQRHPAPPPVDFEEQIRRDSAVKRLPAPADPVLELAKKLADSERDEPAVLFIRKGLDNVSVRWRAGAKGEWSRLNGWERDSLRNAGWFSLVQHKRYVVGIDPGVSAKEVLQHLRRDGFLWRQAPDENGVVRWDIQRRRVIALPGPAEPAAGGSTPLSTGLEELRSFDSVEALQEAYPHLGEVQTALRQFSARNAGVRVVPGMPAAAGTRVRVFVKTRQPDALESWRETLQSRLNRWGDRMRDVVFEVNPYPETGRLPEGVPNLIVKETGAILFAEPSPPAVMIELDTLEEVVAVTPAAMYAAAVNAALKGRAIGRLIGVLTFQDENDRVLHALFV